MTDALYPYQEEGAAWLASRDRAYLADEPGLGKSCQAVTAADMICANTILIIPPASCREVWREQVNRWSFYGHSINVVTDSDSRPARCSVNVVNYDLLGRGFAKVGYGHKAFLRRFVDFDYDVVVSDEAHYLKEQSSLRTMAVLGGLDGQRRVGVCGGAKRLWLLSGTPMPNHPGELWTALVALGATNLEYEEFVTRFCTVQTWGHRKGQPIGVKDVALPDLQRLVGSCTLRRLKKLVMPQLPKLRIDDLPLPVVPIKLEEFFDEAVVDLKGTQEKIDKEKAFIENVWERCISNEADMMSFVNILEEMSGSTSWFARWLGAVKVISLIPIIKDELENNAYRKIVLFYYHRQVGNAIKHRLADFGVGIYDGATTDGQRKKFLHDFRYDSALRVGAIQIIAGGTGLDGLQHSCDETVVVEPRWTPHLNAQAIMRLHRIGQTSSVRARMARLANTLDDYISEVITRKTKTIAQVFRD